NTIAENKALIKYCTENKIEIPKADIDVALKTKQSTIKMMMQTDEMLNQYLENYFLTKEKFEEYQKEDAKGMAAGQAIQAKLVEEAKVSDSDLQKYFNENKDSYSEAKVSAEHILTEDEALSKEIYEKAKDAKTKEDFEKVMNAYKSNGKVKEATDLGSFNKAKMVKEFSDTAFGMEKNTVSKPVKTQFGYHVIFVYDKNEGQVPSINDKKDEITKIVKDQKGQEEYSKLKEKRVKKEKIEIYDIKSPVENYMNQLKSELNIKVYDKKIK
ncbi:MAG: peptidyl-prolyl cis-trans isomerase, partial [Eubacterium sp.]